MSNDDIPNERSLKMSLELAATTVWSHTGRQRIVDAMERFQPEVVHFDNTFPLISPAAYSAARELGAAVVQTLHNYRTICPNALFYRNGQPCEDCSGKILPIPGIMHACYRSSRSQSAVVAGMISFHRARRTWSRDVDMFIALSNFSRSKFAKGGLPEGRIAVKPNFVSGPDEINLETRPPDAVVVGRLSQEKGIGTLLSAWTRHTDLPVLHVLGDGPLMTSVSAVAQRDQRLKLYGHQSRDTVQEHLSRVRCAIVASECYENFPVAIIEAFASATPVIASRRGAMAELVIEGVTGLLFDPGDTDDLAQKIRWSASHPEEMRGMGRNARREYESRYTPDRNYQMLMDIYQRASSRRHPAL